MSVYVGVMSVGGTKHNPQDEAQGRPSGWQPTPVGRLRDDATVPNERTYALWLPLSLLLGFFVIGPFSAIISIVMWQSKKDESIFIDDHGREAANFVLTGLIVTLMGMIPILGWLIAAIWYITGFINLIRASIAASNGEYFRYPLTIRMLS